MFEGAVQTFWPNFRCFHWCNEENVRTIWLLIFALPPCLQPFSPSKFDTEKEDGSTNTVVVTLVRCRLRCKHLVLDVRHLWTIFSITEFNFRFDTWKGTWNGHVHVPSRVSAAKARQTRNGSCFTCSKCWYLREDWTMMDTDSNKPKGVLLRFYLE